MARGPSTSRYLRRLRRLSGPELDRVVGRALFVGGNKIQVEAQISITAGAVSGRNHVPSAPGQPPNQDTGHLANGIETTQTEATTVEVSSNAEYSAALENGTSRMGARPFLGPARDAKRQEVEELVGKAIERLGRSG